MTQLRLRFDPNCFEADDVYWTIYSEDVSLEDLEARGLLQEGGEVTIYCDDDSEAFEMQARLIRGGPADVAWKAQALRGTFRRLR